MNSQRDYDDVNWRYVAASSIGSSHIQTGDSCQDSCLVDVLTSDTSVPLLQILVADGAGSAKCGGQGAEMAIEAAAHYIATQYNAPEFTLSDSFAVDCLLAIRTLLGHKAEASNHSLRDYACTFLGVFSLPGHTLVMQIGDGGIALELEDTPENESNKLSELFVPIVPMSGEYANMTYFVTDENAIDTLETRYFPQTIQKAAVFTDGIQRLALDLKTNTPHTPFFAPFFKTLAATDEAQEDQLEPALVHFLNSEAINERTDDDKTLALAVRVA